MRFIRESTPAAREVHGGELLELLLRGPRGTIACNADPLHRDALVGQNRKSPKLVPLEKAVVHWVEKDRVGRHGTGPIVVIESPTNRGQVLCFELRHTVSLRGAARLVSGVAELVKVLVCNFHRIELAGRHAAD